MNEELRILITAEIADLKKQVADAKEQIDGLEQKGKSGFGGFGKAAAAVGKTVAVGLAAVGGAVLAAGGALAGLAESTREYRTEQAKLATAFQAAGGSAGLAKTTYNDLFRVLGDSGQATEAAQHLAKLTTEEKALSEWTNICQGVYATFGDSLPIESLTEAVNHSAKLGEVQGSLADALEWSGVNVDEFNDALFMCNTESERERLIRDTLNGEYAEAAGIYEETAGSILDANSAQAALTESMAALGAAAEPLITVLKGGFAATLAELVPNIQLFSEGLLDMVNGVEGGTEKVSQGISQLLDGVMGKVTELAPQIVGLIVDILPSITGSILGALPDVLQATIDIIVAVINGIAKMLPDVAVQFAKMIPMLIKVLIDSIPAVLNAAINLLMSLVKAVKQIIPPLVDALPELIDSLLTTLLDNIPVLLDAAIELFGAIVDAIPEIIPSLTRAIPKIISSIIDALIKAIPQIISAAVKMFGAIGSAIPKVIPELVRGLGNIVSAVKTNLVEKLKSALKFKWELPKVKLPKFSIKPSGWQVGDLLEGVIPKLSVTWNARGGVFDKPTVFNYGGSLQGIGEDGAEAVVPLENNLGWLNKLAAMLEARMGNTPVVLQVDGKTLAQTTIGAINELTRQQGKLSLNLM